jgi:hypothetical protein
MLYFLSEVFRHKEAVSEFLGVCFGRMKKGALLVVLDFHDTELESWIEECATDGGLTTLESVDDWRINMAPIEEKNAIEKYSDKFGQPKLQAKVFARVFRKD